MNAPITVEATPDQLLVRRPPGVDVETWSRISRDTIAHLDAFVDKLQNR